MLNAKLRKYYSVIVYLWLSSAVSYADTSPFTSSFSEIEQAQNTLLFELKDEIEKKHIQAQRLKHEMLIKEQKEAQKKRKEQEKRRVYIQRRTAEYALYEAIEAEKSKIALKKLQYDSRITAKVDISQQYIEIFKGDTLLYTWKVSTARRGYKTPRGEFQPLYITKMHYSRKYDNSPMPYSVFFHGGYAMHGTSYVHRLGTPASHGCVRLHTSNAKTFYELVRKYGKENTHIIIED